MCILYSSPLDCINLRTCYCSRLETSDIHICAVRSRLLQASRNFPTISYSKNTVCSCQNFKKSNVMTTNATFNITLLHHCPLVYYTFADKAWNMQKNTKYVPNYQFAAYYPMVPHYLRAYLNNRCITVIKSPVTPQLFITTFEFCYYCCYSGTAFL